jgi:hypothetical protein
MGMLRIIKKALAICPEKPRLAIIRRAVSLDYNWHDGLEIQLATSQSDLEAAFKLLHDSYVATGFMDPHPSGMRVLRQHLLPQSSTLIAKWNGKVVATLSLIRDNSYGLPSEGVYDISTWKAADKRHAEVSSLALAPEVRGQLDFVLFPLFKFMYLYATQCFGINRFLIGVVPEMADLYKAMLCFETIPGVTAREYAGIKGKVVVPLFLDLDTVQLKFKKIFSHRKDSQNLHKFFLENRADEKFTFPQRKFGEISDPVITPRIMSELFFKKAKIQEKLSAMDLSTLAYEYPQQVYSEIIRMAIGLPTIEGLVNRNMRTDTSIKVKISSVGNSSAEIWNVSKSGMMLITQENLKIDSEVRLVVELVDGTAMIIQARVFRIAHSKAYGLRVEDSSQDWERFVNELELPAKDLALVA